MCVSVCVFGGVTRLLKIKQQNCVCVCVYVVPDWAQCCARLALARLLSARVIKLLTGLYRGARGNMLLPD